MPTPQRKSSPSPFALSGLVSVGIIAAAVVIAALVIAAAMRETARIASEAIGALDPSSAIATALPAATPTIVARPSAILQARAANELASMQTLLSTVVEVEKARVGNILYERLVLIACGRVKAGVRLNEIGPDDVRVSQDGRTARVRMPPAELLDAYL